MESVLEPLRRIGTLAGFARKAGPMLWERMAEDRRREVLPAPHRPNLASWTSHGLHATWLGHSTVLLSIDGFRILTDPVFSTRIGVGLGPVTIGMKRLVAPALEIAALPVPHLILLSHAHMDHLDLPSLRKLKNPQTVVVTAKHTSDLVGPSRFQAVHELGWSEARQVGPARISAFEVNHWGARMRTDTHRGYNGYVIETPRYRVMFGGDTAYTNTFRQLRTSRRIDLAIMPIGAYDPWIHAHCNPEQALAMANDAGADVVLPVHHQTFKLSSEGYEEPIERLSRAVGNDGSRIAIRGIGDEFHRN